MKADIAIHRHITCPYCGDTEGFRCDHILSGEWSGSFGPWHCNACGRSIDGHKTADGSIEIELHPETLIRTIDVLVLRPQAKPVYFIVRGMRFENVSWRKPDHDEADGKRFYYESHSCPTNWLKPEMVYFDGDADPHGLIEFVATRDESTFPPDEDVSPNDHDRAFVEFIESKQLEPGRTE